MEDHSSARKSKNNLALIRKFAFNLICLAKIKISKDIGGTIPEARTWLQCHKMEMANLIFKKMTAI